MSCCGTSGGWGGGWWPSGPGAEIVEAGSLSFSALVTAPNLIRLVEFISPSDFTFDRIACHVAIASATDTFRLGVYSEDLATLIASCDPFAPSFGGMNIRALSAGATADLVSGGRYWFALEGTDGTASVGARPAAVFANTTARELANVGALPASAAAAITSTSQIFGYLLAEA